MPNLKTNDEAARTWCPMARVPYFDPNEPHGTGGVTINRTTGTRNPVECRCQGDACAMWIEAGTRSGPADSGRVPVGFCGLIAAGINW